MDGVKPVCIHVIRKATAAANTTYHHKLLPWDTQLGKGSLHGIQDRVIPTSRAPTNIIWGYKIFFGQVAFVSRGSGHDDVRFN